MPPLVPQPDHGPAGVIRGRNLAQGEQGELQLPWARMAGEAGCDGVLIGLIAELPLHHAPECPVVDGGRELLHLQQRRGHGLRRAMACAAGRPRPLIAEPSPPFLDTTARCVSHGGPLQARLATAFRHGFGKEHHRPKDGVVMVHGINEVQRILGKVFCSRHAGLPAPGGTASGACGGGRASRRATCAGVVWDR